MPMKPSKLIQKNEEKANKIDRKSVADDCFVVELFACSRNIDNFLQNLSKKTGNQVKTKKFNFRQFSIYKSIPMNKTCMA